MSEQMGAPIVPPPARARWKSLISLDNRCVAPAFITCILLAGHLSFGILESYPKTLLAIIVSILLELVLGRIFYRKWLHPASAYITGISVGILIRSPAFWPYALCSAISITSKYVLRVKGRHLWNPSNFGISVMLFLAGDTVASLSIQWGNYLWPMLVIWALGAIIIWRLRRFHITATYVVSFIAFALLRSWITGNPWLSEIAPITGPMYQLFVFFMITDPRTVVKGRRKQMVVAVLIAIMETLIRYAADRGMPLPTAFSAAPAFLALATVGPIAKWIDLRFIAPRPAVAPARHQALGSHA